MNIVLDTNILLHYKNFEDIPWLEETGCGDITIVLTAMVQEEIDDKKDNEKGKIQKRAKAVSSRIADYILNGDTGKFPVKYVESAYATEEERRQYHLDRNDNQILYDVMKSGMDKESVIVVSSDNAMLIRAKQQGFKIHRLDDKYLLKEEPSKEEKEAQAAIKELERLKNRLPKPELVFDNGESFIQIKRVMPLDREAEVCKRMMELRQKWPEKTIEGEQVSLLGYTYSNVSPDMITSYNASRNKYLEMSEQKIRLEVERDDLMLRMKEVNIILVNKGTAATGKMNIFVEISERVKLYCEESKKKVEFKEPVTPSYYPGLSPIPSLYSFYTPNVEMWNMVDYIRDGELKIASEPLNHHIQHGVFTFYVDSATCENFKMKWFIADGALPDPVTGVLNVSFRE